MNPCPNQSKLKNDPSGICSLSSFTLEQNQKKPAHNAVVRIYARKALGNTNIHLVIFINNVFIDYLGVFMNFVS